MKKIVWLISLSFIIAALAALGYVFLWPLISGQGAADSSSALNVSVTNLPDGQAINLPFFLRGKTGWPSLEGQAGIVRVLNSDKQAVTNWVPMRVVAGSQTFVAELPRGDRTLYSEEAWLEFQKDNSTGFLNSDETMLWPVRLVVRP